MFILKNAEELNNLFTRNKEINMLLDKSDRNALHDLINEVSEENCSNSLRTFLALQVGSNMFIFE